MKGLFQHPVRVTGRLLWLGLELLLIAVMFIPCVLFRSRAALLVRRACWLQTGCRRVLRVFGASIESSGPVPETGLLVSNHLGYFDILAIGAIAPCVFVAKSEVKTWPVLGWFARLGGTLFAERQRRTQVAPLTQELRAALETGVLLVLFPEGTSSSGETLLPFKSALLEPATTSFCPLSASLISYELEDGDVAEEVCYWKDMTLLPHLLNLLSKRRVQVRVRFSELRAARSNRKELARQLHAEVLRLKELRPSVAV